MIYHVWSDTELYFRCGQMSTVKLHKLRENGSAETGNFYAPYKRKGGGRKKKVEIDLCNFGPVFLKYNRARFIRYDIGMRHAF